MYIDGSGINGKLRVDNGGVGLGFMSLVPSYQKLLPSGRIGPNPNPNPNLLHMFLDHRMKLGIKSLDLTRILMWQQVKVIKIMSKVFN